MKKLVKMYVLDAQDKARYYLVVVDEDNYALARLKAFDIMKASLYRLGYVSKNKRYVDCYFDCIFEDEVVPDEVLEGTIYSGDWSSRRQLLVDPASHSSADNLLAKMKGGNNGRYKQTTF